jgi:hypothetical protein
MESESERIPTARRSDRLRVALLVAIIGYVVLCAAVTAVRWNYLARIGDLFKVTGSEGPAVYSVWKARHGYPLYEWPERDNLSPTLYNFLSIYRMTAC